MATDDASLRKELKSLGVDAGPITDSTRPLYVKKLKRLSTEGGARGSNSPKQQSRQEHTDSNGGNTPETMDSNHGYTNQPSM